MANSRHQAGRSPLAQPTRSRRDDVQSSNVQRAYAWACEQLYHEWAWSYELVAWLVSLGHWAAWRRLALDQLGPDENHILEIGFGTGNLLAEARLRGRGVIGLEPSWQMQRVAWRKLARHGLRPPRVTALAQAMPFTNGAFDAVIATFPAPYIVDPASLNECARVLRTGGRLIVVGLWVTPTNRSLAQIFPVFLGPPAPQMLDRVSQRLSQAGFSVHIGEERCGWAEVSIIVGERQCAIP